MEELVDYYSKRAAEYDRIYEKPERQEELARLKGVVREMFAGEEVLEVASGTGYWTEAMAETARSITAVDINESVLEIARARRGREKVRFIQADVYELPDLPKHTACFCGFWWSHMPKGRIAEFLAGLQRKLRPGAKILFVDNTYVGRSSSPVTRTDQEGNTYQTRKLADGSTFEVLKNFPTEWELRDAVREMAESARYEALTYYWMFSCQARGRG